MPTPRKTLSFTPAALLAALAGTALGQSTVPFPAQFQLSSLLPANGGNGSDGFVINGIDVNDYSGRSVSSAGDVNGDGIDDLLIGARYADPNGNLSAGESYVVFGAVGLGAGGVINLSSLNGTNGFVINGIDASDYCGRAVSSAGDVNGDGIDDLIIGARYADPNGNSIAGESYVVFGAAGVGSGGAIELSSLNGTNGFVLNGIDSADVSGVSVSSAGDVNGDGIDDLIIGARYADPNGRNLAGESYVVFGAAGVGAGGVIELSSLNGTNGFVINGIDADDRSGTSVSCAGDVNGDGIDDLIIGAYLADPNGNGGAGESYVVFGAAGVGSGGAIELSSLNGTNGFVINGIDVGDLSGCSVSSAGDVNGDGIDDLIIGAERADLNLNDLRGESYVVFGAADVGSGGVIELSSLNGANGFVLNGIDAYDYSGVSVSSAGDVNGDGIDDLIIGAYYAGPNGITVAGESYVVFGAAGVGAGGVLSLSSLNGTNGFVLNGIDAFDRSGVSVSSAGDVNGDGIDDLIIGAYQAGESYVVFGRANGQRWISPTGGDWDTGSKWQEGAAPVIGIATIDTPIGVTVNGPAGAVFLDSLILGASLGQTTLDLQATSLVSVVNPFSLPASAALTGAGTFLSSGLFTNNGLVSLDGMSLLAPVGLINESAGEIKPIDGFVDGALTNLGDVDISPLSSPSTFARLELTGVFTNAIGGETQLRQGDVELDALGGVTNLGTLSIAFASAGVLGPVINTGPIDPATVIGATGSIELASLDGTNGFVLNGIDVDDYSGNSVSSAGDVNGDGIDDLIIGAYYADPNGNSKAGESYVVFGAVGLGAGGVIDLSSLNGPNGFVLNGIDVDDYSGNSVSSAGDVNGDGIDDLIIGAYYADPNGNSKAGESYVVFGAAGVGAGGSINLSSLNGTNGFVINGIDAYDYSGVSVSCAGDVNGDGIDDLIIGAREADPNGNGEAGESYVVFGAVGLGAGGVIDLSSLNGPNGFVINGIDANDQSGASVSSAGDVNGDGIDDLIIGAKYADPNGNNLAGESYVVFGAVGVGAGGSIELSSLNGANGFVLNGIDANDRSGVSVSSAGDVNGDGIDDLIIGAFYATPNLNMSAGESYVVFGAVGVGAGGVINLSALNGANGFVVHGIDASDQSGFSISSAGDVNGDGIDDLIIGAFYATPNLNMNAGESYVVFGAVGVGAGGTIELSSLNGANGFVLNGVDANDYSGRSVSCAGDVNGDGIGDLIIGAGSADPNGISQAGESYVVFGAEGIGAGGVIELSLLDGANGFVLNGIDMYDQSGTSVASVGDVNGDGIDDLIIGARFAAQTLALYAGESYVVFGAAGIGVGGVIELSSLNGINGFVINGVDANDLSGSIVSSAGDVNGDGIADMIIGAYHADPNGNSFAGESYVVFGAVGVGAGGTIELSSLNGANGFVLNGIDTYDYSGQSVSCAGDINGDGIDDLIIGASTASPNLNIFAGESYVLFGRANGNVWTSPTGGNFDWGGNWQGGRAPIAGFTMIDTPIGVTVSGPTGVVFLETLVLGAGSGRTTLDLRASSLVSVNSPFSLPASAALTGAGTFFTNGLFTNDGLVSLDGMSLLAPAGLTVGLGGVVESSDGFIDSDVTNNGRIDLSGLGQDQSFKQLELDGLLTNTATGEILLRFSTVTLDASAGIDNSGRLDIVFSMVTVIGDVENATASSQISVTGGSAALFTDDVVNAGNIVLSDDSTIIILGTLTGNGVTGQGGGATAGTVFIAGGLQPGLFLGVAEFGGNVDLGGSALTVIELGGTTPGVDQAQIATIASLRAGGTLRVMLVNGFTPSPGDVYHVLDFASVSGSFSSIVLDQALIDAGADTSNLLITGEIIVPLPCLGDADGSGEVNFSDINAVLANWLIDYTPGTGPGDANGDGVVNFTDVNVVLANWLVVCP